MTALRVLVGLVTTALVASGCDAPDRVTPSVVAHAPAACTVSGTTVGGSMVITDPQVLARFGFTRTMGQIRTTARVGADVTTRSLWQAWMRTFAASPAPGDCDDVDVHGYGLRCPRTAEATLAAVDPFSATSRVRFEPVALVNRFDLGPGSGFHCGVYRIIYAMRSSDPAVGGRAFLAFDGALYNPRLVAGGPDGCVPVWRFWQGLSADADPVSRADQLERFFYLGTAVPGFGAVVRAGNYGLADGVDAVHGEGEITGNFFVDEVEWNLRRYQLRRTCAPTGCGLRFELVPLPSTPADELFADTSPLTNAERKALGVAVRASSLQFDRLNFVLPTPDDWNELESVVATPPTAAAVRYDLRTSPYLRRFIGFDLNHNGGDLTIDDALRRATTQTCAGCHGVSSGVALGGGLTWPASLGAVHIDESGALSPALTDLFLPMRIARLEAFINRTCPAE